MEVPVHQSSPPIDDEVHWIYMTKTEVVLDFVILKKEVRKSKNKNKE
jgi:hypothetical protein